MTTFSPKEDRIFEAFDLLFSSLESFMTLSADSVLGDQTSVDLERPEWLGNVMEKLNKTLFRKSHQVLSPERITHYQTGYALGILKWGHRSTQINLQRTHISLKAIPHSTRLKRRIGKRLESFLCRTGIQSRKTVSAYIPKDAKRRIKQFYQEGVGPPASEYHRGYADGIEGIGPGTANDSSDDASKIHLHLALCWLVVQRMSSVTELHEFLSKVIGPELVGDKKRVEKICERIGLRLREPGRPKKTDSAESP